VRELLSHVVGVAADVASGNIEHYAQYVVAPRYELWRSLEGRRTRDQVRTFEWSVDPEPYLDCWLGPVFRWLQEPGSTSSST
jgi:hypothetical protein